MCENMSDFSCKNKPTFGVNIQHACSCPYDVCKYFNDYPFTVGHGFCHNYIEVDVSLKILSGCGVPERVQ